MSPDEISLTPTDPRPLSLGGGDPNLLTLSPTGGGSNGGPWQPLDDDLTYISAIDPADDDIIQRKDGHWTNRSLAQLADDLGFSGGAFQPLDSDLTEIAGLEPVFGDTLLFGADGDNPTWQIAGLQNLLDGKQTIDPSLTALSGLTGVANRVPYFTSGITMAQTSFPASGRSLVGLAPAANTMPYYNTTTTATSTPLTPFARTLLDDTDAATMRTTLGVGTGAFQTLRAQDVDGTITMYPSSDPGRNADTNVYLSQTGAATFRTLQTLLPADVVTSGKDAAIIREGTIAGEFDQYGNIIAGERTGIGTAQQIGTTFPTCPPGFFFKRNSGTTFAGALLWVWDADDVPDLSIARSYGAKCEATTPTPVTVGWSPIDLDVNEIGDAWADLDTGGVASGHPITGVPDFAGYEAYAGVASVSNTGGEEEDEDGQLTQSPGALLGKILWKHWTDTPTPKLQNVVGAFASVASITVTGATDTPPFPAGTPHAVAVGALSVPVRNMPKGVFPVAGGTVSYTLAGVTRTFTYTARTTGTNTAGNPTTVLTGIPPSGTGSITNSMPDGTQLSMSFAYLDTEAKTITIDSPGIPRPRKIATLLKESNSTVINYQSTSGGTSMGPTEFRNCTIGSGTLALVPGNKIYQRFLVGENDSINQVTKPHPRKGADFAAISAGVGLGRMGWKGTEAYADSTAPRGDKAKGLTKMVASIAGQAEETFIDGKHGASVSIKTTPVGTTGIIDRLKVEAIGLTNALYGVSFGVAHDLTPGNSATRSCLNPGQFAKMNVNQLTATVTTGSGTITPSTFVAGDATHNEVQKLTLSGFVEGDEFTVSWTRPDGFSGTTEPFAYGPVGTPGTAGNDLQRALEAVTYLDTGDLDDLGVPKTKYLISPGDVAGSRAGDVYQFVFGFNVLGSASRFKLSDTVPVQTINDPVADGHALFIRSTVDGAKIKNKVGGDPNQIATLSGGDVTLNSGQVMFLLFDMAQHTWFEVGNAAATGGGAAAVPVQENGTPVVATPTALNFLTGFDVSSVGGVATIDIDESELTGIPQASVTNLTSDLALKAPLASPTFTGNPLAPTPAPGDNDTSIATTAFVTAAVAGVGGLSNNAVTDAYLRDSAALSVIGRSANSSGDPADIAAASDGDVLRRSGTALGFGAIPQASVTNLVTDLAGKQAAGSYQPLDADLTAIAALTTDSFGRGLLPLTTAAAVRTYIGAGTGSGSSVFVTPEDFGATGNGTTDDSTAITNWLAADGPKRAPADADLKNYLVAGTFTIAQSDDIDFGGSTLSCKNSSTTKILVTANNVTIRNLVFDGRRTGTSVVSRGIEWQGADGKMFDVEVSNHNDSDAAILVNATGAELACTRCEAHNNGNRATGDSGSVLRAPTAETVSISYGMDGFACILGRLETTSCKANYNSRCGLYTSATADDGCTVDLVECKGNFSALIRTTGSPTSKNDRTYNGTAASVCLRSNNGVANRIIMDGVDASSADASRYGLQIGAFGGGSVSESGENWTVEYVQGTNFRWTSAPASAAELVHLRGGHNMHIKTIYANDVEGYACAFGGGANNIASGDNARPVGHRVDQIFGFNVSNPVASCTVGRDISFGHIYMNFAGPVDIGEGTMSEVERLSIDKITAHNCTSGVFVNTDGTSDGVTFEAGHVKDVYVGEIYAQDCTSTAGGWPDALVWLLGPTHIGRVYARTRTGGTKPDYVVKAETGSSFIELFEPISYNAAASTTASGGVLSVRLQPYTASKALVTDASGYITPSTVTSTELGYLSGATSNIQTQINSVSGGSGIPPPASPVANDFLQYKSSAWTNRTPAQALVDLAAANTTTLQPYDADLATIAGLTATTDNVIQSKGSAWSSRTMAQLLADLAAANSTTLQPYDAELAAIAGLTSAANKGFYFTGAGTAAIFDLPAAGRALISSSAPAANTVPYYTSGTATTVTNFPASGRSLVDVTAAADAVPYFTSTTVASTFASTSGGRALMGVTGAADKFPYYTAAGAAATADLSSAMRTFLTTSSSANLAALLTDETGSGANVHAVSPALTGSPTAPTQTAADNSTKIATTAYADAAAAAGTTDNELLALASTTAAANKIPYFTGASTAATADFPAAMRTFLTTPSSANFAALITDETGTGVNVFATDPALAGNPTAPTPATDDADTSIATTAHVRAQKDRDTVVQTGQGAIALTMPENQAVAVTPIGTGSIFWTAIGLKKGDSVTNCLAKMTVVGATLSLVKMCIATASGTTATVVAVSGNVNTTFTAGANAWKSVPCAYTVPSDGMYYIGILAVGTTGPTICRQNSQIPMQIGSNPFPYGLTGSQTDIVLSTGYTVTTTTSPLCMGVN